MIRPRLLVYLYLCLAFVFGYTQNALATEALPQNSFQLAKITFLPDAAEDALDFGSAILPDDYNSDGCENYPLSFCPEGALCEQCPFDVSKYRAYSCVAPYIEANGSCVCPTAVDLNNPNDVCTQYCGDNCIAKTCTPTSNQSGCTNGTQNCDNGCGQNTRQCCVPCTNKITTKPANSSYTYASCTDGDGTKQIQTAWTCNSGYHEKNGACEKDCIVNSCSGYTLSSCPSDKICEECTQTAQNCSTDGTMYKAIGCKDNKKDTDTFWCSVPKTTDCTALGYTRSSGSCGSLTQIACPFDSSKVACIDFE